MKNLTAKEIYLISAGVLSSECVTLISDLFKKIFLGEITTLNALGVILTSDCNICDVKEAFTNVNIAITSMRNIY